MCGNSAFPFDFWISLFMFFIPLALLTEATGGKFNSRMTCSKRKFISSLGKSMQLQKLSVLFDMQDLITYINRTKRYLAKISDSGNIFPSFWLSYIFEARKCIVYPWLFFCVRDNLVLNVLCIIVCVSQGTKWNCNKIQQGSSY